MTRNRRFMGVAVALVAAAASACDGLLEVDNPGVIEASAIDPKSDAETFSLSAQTNFFNAFDDVAVYGAFFSGEAWVDDTFLGRKDVGRRSVNERDALLVSDLYAPLALAATSNLQVLNILKGTPSESSVSTARAALNLGFSLQLMAETFCQGVLDVGAPMSQEQTSREAIRYFEEAVRLAGEVKAPDLATAARVGLARAYLQVGEHARALEVAAQVPAAFTYDAAKVDNPSAQSRLGNTAFFFTAARPGLVVPPYYRELQDPRVPFKLKTDAKGKAVSGQGGALAFYFQTKYSGFGAPMRLASGLEARYISAEAALKLGNVAPAVALVAERRAAYPTSRDGSAIDFVAEDGVLTQLLDQKSRDFYLEGKHLGDWVRNPQAVPYVLPAGSAFYDALSGGTIGTATCLPVPAVERENNPNFPKA